MKANFRHTGVDTIKAVSIVMVLVWHLQPVTKGMLPPESSFFGISAWRTVENFYHYVTLLAVPSFIIISLYLFVEKSSVDGQYWKKRLLRLAQLFLFWTSIQFIFYLLVGGARPVPFKTIFPNGGPDLPYVGGSVFYFFSVLIKSTLLTFLFLKLPDRIKLILSTIIITLSCVYFALAPIYKIPISTMSMKNFYLYTPIAYYMLRYQQKFLTIQKFIIIGYFIAVIYEEFYLNSFVAAYGRLSVVLGALSLISIFLQCDITSNRVIEFLAKHSLGIFSLHKYWQLLFIFIMMANGASKQPSTGHIAMQQSLLFLFTIIFTFFSVYLLGKTKMKSYIT